VARRLKLPKSEFKPLPEPALGLLTRDAQLRSGWERDYDGALRDAADGNPKRLFDLLQAGRALSFGERVALAELLEDHLPRPRGRPNTHATGERSSPPYSFDDAISAALSKKPAQLIEAIRTAESYQPEKANILIQFLGQVLPHKRGSPKKAALHQAAIFAHSQLEWVRATYGRLNRKLVEVIIEDARVNTERWTGVAIDSRALHSLMREAKSRVG